MNNNYQRKTEAQKIQARANELKASFLASLERLRIVGEDFDAEIKEANDLLDSIIEANKN